MTGFSRVSEDYDWGSLSVEMSGVNSRYIEVNVRLPKDLSAFEPLLHRKVRSSFRRGKIQVRADLQWSPQFRMGELNVEVLKAYFEKLDAVRKDLGLGTEIRLDSLISLPGATESSSVVCTMQEDVAAALEQLTDMAIGSMKNMRQKEGKDLLDDITFNLSSFENTLCQIGNSWNEVEDSAISNLRDRIEKITERFGCEVDESRLAQEIAIIADKWDISEEISRAKSHIGKFRSILDKEESQGRKLDFLIQELNREVNTMASKVADSHLRWLVVEEKTSLERIREQVQNVE